MAESAETPAFSRTERTILRALASQGGSLDDGYAAIAERLDLGLRSVERAVVSLRARGLVRTHWQRRKNATITLTDSGRAATRVPISEDRRSPAVNGSAAQPAPITPRDFIGDQNALTVARTVLKIRRSDVPSELAQVYLEHARAEELARISGFLDERGCLEIGALPTRYDMLDDGLRAHFAAKARRAAARSRTLRSQAYIRDLLDVDG